MNQTVFDPLASKHIRFTRPVCAGTGDPDYPLQRLGSGFVVAFEGGFYLVTARHAITNQKADPKRIQIPLMDGRSGWWPTNAVVFVDWIGGTSNICGDMAVYRMDDASIRGVPFGNHDFLTICNTTRPKLGRQLFAHGYPDVDATMDTKNRQMIATLVVVEGKYGGSAPDQGIHLFTSEELLSLDPNGLSGGPVTTLEADYPGRHVLAGIIVRGGHGSGRLHFIGLDYIYSCLQFVMPKFRAQPIQSEEGRDIAQSRIG